MATRVKVNPPHLTFQLVEFAVGSTWLSIFLIQAISLYPPSTADPAGWVLVGVAVVFLSALGYALRAYLRSQWTLAVLGDRLVLTRWWDGWQGNPELQATRSEIHRFIVRRPLYLDVETADGVLRVGTFWWRKRQFRELEQLASDANLEVEESRPEPPAWLSGSK